MYFFAIDCPLPKLGIAGGRPPIDGREFPLHNLLDGASSVALWRVYVTLRADDAPPVECRSWVSPKDLSPSRRRFAPSSQEGFQVRSSVPILPAASEARAMKVTTSSDQGIEMGSVRLSDEAAAAY
jgi:hypothetical protein